MENIHKGLTLVHTAISMDNNQLFTEALSYYKQAMVFFNQVDDDSNNLQPLGENSDLLARLQTLNPNSYSASQSVPNVNIHEQKLSKEEEAEDLLQKIVDQDKLQQKEDEEIGLGPPPSINIEDFITSSNKQQLLQKPPKNKRKNKIKKSNSDSSSYSDSGSFSESDEDNDCDDFKKREKLFMKAKEREQKALKQEAFLNWKKDQNRF